MEERELFKDILDDDEQILKVYKPNKLRAYFTGVFIALLFSIWFIVEIFISVFDEDLSIWAVIVPAIIIVLIICLTILFMSLWLKKTIYCVTDKRILIRSGFIGVDYKSLDYDMLGAVTVNVSWIDKLLRKNTGVISFGSMSSPLTNQSGAKFVFSYIKNPYVVYKEVKAVIDTHKNK